MPASTSWKTCASASSATAAGIPGLNTWLYLKQAGLDPDKDQVELVDEVREEDATGAKKVKGKSLLNMVADGDVDAAFVNQPRTEQARRMGLKIIDIPAQDMIFFMTISSSAKMVEGAAGRREARAEVGARRHRLFQDQHAKRPSRS